jgi:hypothetical protein
MRRPALLAFEDLQMIPLLRLKFHLREILQRKSEIFARLARAREEPSRRAPPDPVAFAVARHAALIWPHRSTHAKSASLANLITKLFLALKIAADPKYQLRKVREKSRAKSRKKNPH